MNSVSGEKRADPHGRRAEVQGSEPDSLNRHLWDIWSATAISFPERDAVVSMWQSPQTRAPNDLGLPGICNEADYLRLSYGHLHSEALRLESWLLHLGCVAGMKVGAILWNSADWAVYLWATVKLDMVFVPIDPRNVMDLPHLFGKLELHVLVAQDEIVAAAIDALNIPPTSASLRIQCSGPRAAEWLPFHSFSPEKYILQQDVPRNTVRMEHSELADQVAMLVLTSGTTGQPKICQHTHKNLMSQACKYDPKGEDPKERWLVHTPISHIFAINNVLRAWKEGGTVIFPSKTFEVESTMKALIHEKCTIMSATPTLIKALLSHSSFSGQENICLDLVTLGGTSITEEDVQLCRKAIRARNAIKAYGLTEGAPLISWKRNDRLLKEGYHPGVGRILPGASIRICQPGTQDILSVGEIGELHVAGTSIVPGYHGENDCPAFYEDDGVRWFTTGDQGMIDEDGIIYVLGRYKDVIIRGGENIQPAKIENALSGIHGLQATVIGVSDALAGQVPVAVVRLPVGIDKGFIARKVLALDPLFALGGVYSLEELGLADFPLTTLGKIKKGLLVDLVTKHRQDLNEGASDCVSRSLHESLVVSLIDTWEQVTATRPQRDQDILFLADSITMLRFCDAVVRLCGKQIYLQDLVNHNTVEKQAKLLEERERDNIGASPQKLQASAEPRPCEVTVTEMTTAEKTADAPKQLPILSHTAYHRKEVVEIAKLALVKLELPDSELEDVIPIRSSLRRFALGQRPQSYHVSFSFRVPGKSHSQIHQAIAQLLRIHPLLRAVLVQDGDRLLHAIPTYSDHISQRIFFDHEVDTAKEAIEYAGSARSAHPTPPFMLRATVVNCRSNGLNYLSLTFNHSTMDALAVVPWHRNLDLLLEDGTAKLPEMTAYKAFADLHEKQLGSEMSRAAVNFYVKRLRGISLLGKALWPLQKAPGWMISDDSASPHKAKRDTSRQTVWKGQWEAVRADFEVPRLSCIVHLSQLARLTERFDVKPPNFAKAAIMLLNVLQTGSSHAIFTSWESGRAWPFLPKWIEDKLPPAMSIDGPTVEWVLNMTEIIATETVSEFLKRVEEGHKHAVNHAHACWSHVARELQEEAEVVKEASFRQGFVWDMSLLGIVVPKGYITQFKVLEPVNRHNWADCGLFWNAFMIDPQNLYFIASWDTAQMNKDDVQGYCDTLAEIMRRLATEENWERQIGEILRTKPL